MLSVYVYCTKEYDAGLIIDLLRDVLIRMGGEQMTAEVCWEHGARKDEETGPWNLMIYELSQDRDFDTLLTLRKLSSRSDLLIIDGGLMRPEAYIRPDLRPSGLLSMPLETDQLVDLLKQVIYRIYLDREREDPDCRLHVKSGMERYYLPFSSIRYFEAKEKSIYLHHEHGIICFRDSIKRLEQILPYYFFRTHRGIIVNSLHIRIFNPAAGKIIMADSTVIPMSRSFWRRLEKMLKKRETDKGKTDPGNEGFWLTL